MIKNNTLTYPGADSTFATWQPSDPVLHAFLLATLLTVLVYQSVNIILDLLLGFKERGTARVSDISTLLLTEEFSFLSLLATLLQSRTINSWNIHGFLAKCPAQSAPTSRVSAVVYLKFLLLVVLIPLINLAAIIISLENDVIVTFRDVNFGGIALGVNEDRSTLAVQKPGSLCTGYRTKYRRLETPIAAFYTCSLLITDLPREPTVNTTLTLREANRADRGDIPPESVLAEFKDRTNLFQIYMHADVSTDDVSLRLRERISVGQGRQLFETGLQSLSSACSLVDKTVQSFSRDDKWSIFQQISCRSPSDNIVIDALAAMLQPVTIMKAEKFEVLFDPSQPQPNSEKVRSGDEFPLLRRRRSFVSFAGLCVAVACVIFLRLGLKAVTNNDILVGVEFILKSRLGISCCDSMLQDDSRVWYKDKIEVTCRDEVVHESVTTAGSREEQYTADDKWSLET